MVNSSGLREVPRDFIYWWISK